MKKRIIWIAIAVLVVAAVGVAVFFGLNKKDSVDDLPVTLKTPQIRLNQDLSIAWDAVESAESYLININGSDTRTTKELSYPAIAAPGEYSISILALGGGGRSERSQPVHYVVYAVNLPKNDLYTVSGSQFVGQNQDYSFTVKIAEGCTDCTPVIKVNGKELTSENGVYNIPNVQEDLTVSVEGVELNRYTVTLPTDSAYTIIGNDFALYGENYTFNLELLEKYNKSELIVKANGHELIGNQGSYTVEHITSDMEITVSGITVNQYTVELTPGRGYTITPEGTMPVSYGDSLTFQVIADSASYGLTVKVNDKVIAKQNGNYTIADIDEDKIITVEVSGLPALTVVDMLLEPDSWQGTVVKANGKSLTMNANPILTGEYLKKLWNQGYTHLVYTVKLSTPGAFVHGSSNVYRYWAEIPANTEVDLRIDLNEFHDGATWYSMNYCNMVDGSMIISNPRAYRSAETLQWKKTNSNMYFAVEDGYYVLSCGYWQGVSSPTQWVEKYCVSDRAASKTWYVYTDYINPGNNYRSILWGWGSAINNIMEGTEGGWSAFTAKTNAYTPGDVFSLTLESDGVARFKISDVVSNVGGESYAYINDSTFMLTSVVPEQKFFLASTPELVKAGYKKLQVTLTGSLENGATLWYGDDDWSDGEGGIGAEHFTNGQCTFEVDLSIMDEDEYFTLMTSGNSASNPITDLQVKIVPVGSGQPPVQHQVTLPTGIGYTVEGKTTAIQGRPYTFTVTVNEGYNPQTLTVRVNGRTITPENGVYTVDTVTGKLVVAVAGPELYTYRVTAPTGEGFAFEGEATVKYGQDYVFTVTPERAEDNVIVMVNAQTVTPIEGKYTVSSVKEDLTITAECLSDKFAVVIPTGNTYTVTPAGKQQIERGGSVSFTVLPNNPDATVFVTANGKTLTGLDGVYVLSDISENITVTISAYTVADKLLSSESWSGGGTAGDGTLAVPANSQIKAEYLKELWDEGYTHLVFTVNPDTAGAFVNGSSNVYRYWQETIPAGRNTVLRIDLNEFHDGATWYSLNFCNMTSGEMIVSDPKAYKSAETLLWKKDNSNIYFAIEDGYYVLSSGNYQGVTSPTEWMEKYCVSERAASKTWYVYTDYIEVGNNYRSVLWGWGTPINNIMEGTLGGWSVFNAKRDAYKTGDVFGLFMESTGIARFKISDFVSNVNTGSLTEIADNTYQFSSVQAEQKYYLASTHELMAAGYTKLNVTLTGSLADGVELWYGDDDWTDSETGINGGHFVDGQYTFQVDLSIIGENEYFTLMTSGNSVLNPITDMQITIEPVKE